VVVILADAGIAPAQETDASGSNRFRQMAGTRVLHFIAVFALIYVGIEVTLGGTFLVSSPGTLLKSSRLDCDVYYRGAKWWPVSRICLLWFLWR
jgi:fucose permease